jgi:hypothetical protein
MNALPCFETSVTTHTTAQCHILEGSEVCLTYHKSHFVHRECKVVATWSWSKDIGHRNSLSKGQLGAGLSVFIAMSTPNLGFTQLLSNRYREHDPQVKATEA